MPDSETHHRKSIRYKKYDYAQNGAYFVTICARSKQCLFGNITNGKTELSEAGEIVSDCWINLQNRYPGIKIDLFIVMPNHLHGIIVIDPVGAGLVSALPESAICENINKFKYKNRKFQNARADTRPAPTNANARTLGDIICAFKSLTTNEYIQGVKLQKLPSFEKSIWQRNYYEHIIRDDDDLDRIREYILNNPINWETDELYASG